MKRNVLVTLADVGHIDQAKQLFSSVYWNAAWDGDYLLLSHGIPEDKLAWFREKGIFVYECGSLDDKRPEDVYPTTVFSKFYIFKDYFKKWQKVIFLDADIIVTYSLDELTKTTGFSAKSDFESDLNHQVNLCYNYEINDRTWIDRSLERLRQKYDLNSISFNSGVMVFDTDLITNDSFSELTYLLKEYRDILNFGDQLALNLFMYKRWTRIDDSYNAFPLDKKTRHAFFKEGVIMPVLHFLGPNNKPWQKGSEFLEMWNSNLSKAEQMNLKKVVPLKEVFTPEQLSESKKAVVINEKPFVIASRHFFDFRELDVLYSMKKMKEFRRLLVKGLVEQYSRYYNRFIPYYFASFIPAPTKASLKKLFSL